MQNIEIQYLETVVEDLNRLVDILYERDYFGFKDSAKQYVDDMKSYIEQHIARAISHIAPSYFIKYGTNMRYFIYNSNKQTSWYIFFQKSDNKFLVRHITNNHVVGHFIR
ncbi:MAG: hypothetical protein LBT27_01545 [Prevotellaceae bacterium]|jgi:hypothetical protein|nr:hypothetical protein [Prevotellaceae bacterium]